MLYMHNIFFGFGGTLLNKKLLKTEKSTKKNLENSDVLANIYVTSSIFSKTRFCGSHVLTVNKMITIKYFFC